MSRYDIRLAIGYSYPGFVRDARHILRVSPRQTAGQRIERFSLEVAPAPAETASETDFFGNAIDHILIDQPHEALSIEMRARVAVDRPLPDLARTPALGAVVELARKSRASEGESPLHFLGSGRLVTPSARVAAYLEEGLDFSRPIGEATLDLARRIRSDFRFQAGVTTISTGVEETFAARRGVCQDFSHLMIAGLRGLGLPAAYASGFLRTEPPPGRPRLEGADAMHAWVEVWTGPEGGWLGFDPTNGCFAGEDHVLVARGRDYADVAPIDGVLMTSGPQRHHHSVDMVPIEETEDASLPSR
ncbi:transglutaminase family protein [Aureimonas sp. AU40]|uniref:transglutaminase family protein n=1 Tax=Aureimonas sp. AU40 TaxID=1637747 RepID=UPI0007803A1F|nr:transglutaminase family protein [Aureimonas sp. AU40]